MAKKRKVKAGTKTRRKKAVAPTKIKEPRRDVGYVPPGFPVRPEPIPGFDPPPPKWVSPKIKIGE